MTNPNEPAWTLKGWHVLVALLIFFGAMFIANGLFVYYALESFSGVETQDAYRKGIAYNKTLAEGRRYERLGWHGKIISKGPNLELNLAAEDGTPVRGKKVFGTIGRPSTDKFDRQIAFKDEGSGRYVVENANLKPGNWVVTVEVHDSISMDKAPRFRLKERLWLSQ